MKNYLVVPVCLLIAFSFCNCTNTVTEMRYDTTYVKTGPALARFVSMLPDNSAILLKLNQTDLLPFTSTGTGTENRYLPFVPDSAIQFYCFSAVTGALLDLFPISGTALKDASVNTFALFYLDSTMSTPPGMRFAGGGNNDTGKYYRFVPAGDASLRLINGVNYPASTAVVNIDLDTITNVLATVRWSEMSDYILVPAGKHKLIITTTDTQEVLFSLIQIFDPHVFYTARYIGVHGDSTRTDRLIVDTE